MSNKEEFQKKIDKIAQDFLSKLKGSLVDFKKFAKSLEAGKVNSADHKKILVDFHKISGSAKIFGFENLGKLSVNIEALLNKKDIFKDSDPLKKALEVFLKESENEISSKFKGGKKESSEPEDKSDYKYNILIAEDNELMRDLLKQALTEIDCGLIEAQDGAEALKLIKSAKKPLDLVILDVNMPKKDGFEVLKAIKEKKATKDIPAIMLTRKNEDDNIIKGISGGAIDYITKPFEVEDLIKIISDILCNVKKKILVADDDELIHEMLDGHFSHLGYQFIGAKDGKEALNMIKKEKPDIAIIDYMMPVMDGIAVVRKVREDEKMKSMPIILLTAKSQQENILLGLKSGASDYVTKPFDIDELSQRVSGILQRNENG